MALYGVTYLWFRWGVTYPDQSGDPTIFPFLQAQKFLVKKTPSWKTLVGQTSSGRERRASYWSAPIWQFEVGYDGLIQDGVANFDLQSLLAFYQAQQGQLGTWNYYDRTDNTATAQVFGAGDGATTTFQLSRYINGNANSVEPIYALNGTPTVFVNGTATSVTLGSYGTVTFANAPAAGAVLTWTGSFFFLCRFGADMIDDLSQDMWQIWNLSKLAFNSVKPDRTTV